MAAEVEIALGFVPAAKEECILQREYACKHCEGRFVDRIMVAWFSLSEWSHYQQVLRLERRSCHLEQGLHREQQADRSHRHRLGRQPAYRG